MDYKELEKQAGISEYGHSDQDDPPGLGLNTNSEEQKFMEMENKRAGFVSRSDSKPLDVSADSGSETVSNCQKYIDEMTDEEQDKVEKEADEAGMPYITICLRHGFLPRPKNIVDDNVSDADGLEAEKRKRTEELIKEIKRNFEDNASKNKGRF